MTQTVTISGQIAEHRQRDEDLVSTRLAQAFRDEELAGLELATRALLIALVVIAIWLFVWIPPPRVYFHEMTLMLFAALSIANYRTQMNDQRWPWVRYAVVIIYCGLMSFSMVGYDLLFGDEWPAQMMLRNGTVVYFFVIIAIVALSYTPLLVMCAGLGSALAWSLGVYAIARLPGTLTPVDHGPDRSVKVLLSQHLDIRWKRSVRWHDSTIGCFRFDVCQSVSLREWPSATTRDDTMFKIIKPTEGNRNTAESVVGKR